MPLKNKLLILFIAFTLVPLVLFGALVFSRARNILETVRIAQLNNIADLKKEKIEAFFEERKAGIRSAQHFPTVKKYLPLLAARSNAGIRETSAAALQELDSQLKPFQKAFGYLDVMLTDPHGRIVYVSNDEHRQNQLDNLFPDKSAFEEGKQEIYFTNVFAGDAPGAGFKMFGVAPISTFDGEFIGEVILEIDMGPIYLFVRDNTGLGETGEALIVRRDGNSVLFLSPLTDIPGAALKKRVVFDEKAAIPAQMSSRGEEGSGLSSDYENIEVLAAWRYIPSLRWGVVTKIDAEEAFAPVGELRTVIFSLGLFMTIAGIIAAVALAKTITRPIQALQQGAEAIAAGDLSHRVGTGAHDEIGRLSRSFDEMTEALSRDIASREKAEEEVRTLNQHLEHHVRQLEESNRELEAFSYSVSHDLRSPLRSIDGFGLALLEDYADKLDDEGREYLTRIRGATQRMGQLIDDLLKLSRLARMEMKREEVDLSALAADIASRLMHNHPERPADFIITPGLAALGDERLLTVALENLFGNAWKFSEKTPRTVIEFGVTDAGDVPAFFVKDNGAGFDMAYANKLFSPFQRLHDSAEFSGTGIGLATVKRIFNRHGGRVWIEGSVGKGTTVYFTL